MIESVKSSRYLETRVREDGATLRVVQAGGVRTSERRGTGSGGALANGSYGPGQNGRWGRIR
jgi:hypothetical protein